MFKAIVYLGLFILAMVATVVVMSLVASALGTASPADSSPIITYIVNLVVG